MASEGKQGAGQQQAAVQRLRRATRFTAKPPAPKPPASSKQASSSSSKPPSSSEGEQPVTLELFSMMTIKRLARQMASKVYAKRSTQPTYRMHPAITFDCALAHEIITQMLDFRLRDFK
jgi:hypothetical protein